MTKLWADSDTKFKYNHKNYRDFQFFFFFELLRPCSRRNVQKVHSGQAENKAIRLSPLES